MTNKEKFMEYAKGRIRDKEYKKRKFLIDLTDVQLTGIEKCARGRWRRRQP